MYEKTKDVPFAGADGLAIRLVPCFGQRDGIRVSNAGFSGTAIAGGQAGFSATTVERSGMPVLAAEVWTMAADRVRTLVDVHVPGTPPRGAPV